MPVTPNMNLSLPSVSSTVGPDWAEQLNDAIGVDGTGVDGHDHTDGKGVPIASAALNINADVDFQGNDPINVGMVQFIDQPAALSDGSSLYFLNGDLYVNDGDDVSIRITENGAISAASFGGITGLVSPASASFATDTFTWLYDVDKYAPMATGPLIVRRSGETAPQSVIITPPAALAGFYTITLPPALPVSNSYLWTSSGGAHGYSATALASSVDTASIQSNAVTTAKILDSNVTTAKINDSAVTAAKLATDSVTTAKITALNVTRAKLESVGLQTSSVASSLTAGTATSFTSITNFNVSLTVDTLRPIIIMCQSATTGGGLSWVTSIASNGYCNMRIQVTGASGSSDLNDVLLRNRDDTLDPLDMPVAVLGCVFTPTVVGAHTFTVRYAISGVGAGTLTCNGNFITAYQL